MQFFNRMHWCILLQLPFWKDVHFPFVSNMGVMRLNFNRFHTKNCFKKNDQTHINCSLNVFLIVMIIVILINLITIIVKYNFVQKAVELSWSNLLEQRCRGRESVQTAQSWISISFDMIFFFTCSLSLALSIPPSLARSLCL